MKRVILLLSIARHYLQSFSIGTIYSRSHDSLEFGGYYLCLESTTLANGQGSCPTALVSPQGDGSSCNDAANQVKH